MTAEDPKHQLLSLSKDGMVLQTQSGRKVGYSPQEMLRILGRKFSSIMASQQPDISGLGEGKEIGGDQILDICLKVVEKLNPADYETMSQTDKLAMAEEVKLAIMRCAIDYKQLQVRAAAADFAREQFRIASSRGQQNVFSSAMMSPDSREKADRVWNTSIELAMNLVAGSQPIEVVEAGARNLVTISEATARANEAVAREVMATQLIGENNKLEIKDNRDRQASERAHSRGLQAIERREMFWDKLFSVTGEQVSKLKNGLITTFVGEEGIPVQFSRGLASAFSGFAENSSNAKLAGGSFGGAVGTLGGLFLGITTAELLPLAIVTPELYYFVLGLPTLLLAVSGWAAGGALISAIQSKMREHTESSTPSYMPSSSESGYTETASDSTEKDIESLFRNLNN